MATLNLVQKADRQWLQELVMLEGKKIAVIINPKSDIADDAGDQTLVYEVPKGKTFTGTIEIKGVEG